MKAGHAIFAFVLEGLGIAVMVASFRLGLRTFSNPGPGLFPFLLGILLCLLAIFAFMDSSREAGGGKSMGKVTASRLKHSGAITACLLGFFFSLESLGFLLTTFLFLTALFFLGNPGRRLSALIISAAVTVSAYVVFSLLLGLTFPSGLLGIG